MAAGQGIRPPVRPKSTICPGGDIAIGEALADVIGVGALMGVLVTLQRLAVRQGFDSRQARGNPGRSRASARRFLPQAMSTQRRIRLVPAGGNRHCGAAAARAAFFFSASL